MRDHAGNSPGSGGEEEEEKEDEKEEDEVEEIDPEDSETGKYFENEDGEGFIFLESPIQKCGVVKSSGDGKGLKLKILFY